LAFGETGFLQRLGDLGGRMGGGGTGDKIEAFIGRIRQRSSDIS
jgi:hypothetical protein